MKKVLYFIPAIIVVATLMFVAVTDGLSFNADVWLSLASLIIAGVVLTLNKWWGCLFGAVIGIIIIYSGTQEHGQIINEIPIGVIVCLFYALMGYVCYKSTKQSK